MVKKANSKWRICIDYTDLNRACSKDAYPLPNIDMLVDGKFGFQILSFLDAYSRYNQIRMHPPNEEKRRGICGRHGCQVSKHNPTSDRPRRSLRGTPQIWHAPKPWKMYFQGRWRQVPRLHDYSLGYWSQPQLMHCHTQDVHPNQHPRNPEAEWKASIPVQVPPKAHRKGKAVLQTGQENWALPMGWDLQTSFPNFQEDHNHTDSFKLTHARGTPTPVSLSSWRSH